MFPEFLRSPSGAMTETKKKLTKIQDFRFFPDPERLKELMEKEISEYGPPSETVFTDDEKTEKKIT